MCQAFSKIDDVSITLAFANTEKQGKTNLEIFKEKLGFNPDFDVINYKNINIFGKLKTLTGYFGIKKIIKNSDNYDLIYTRLPIAMILGMKYRKKIVYEAHNFRMHLTNNMLNSYFLKKLKKYSEFENLLKIVTISENLKNKLNEFGIHKEKLIALHDGISEKDYPKTLDMDYEKLKLGLPIDRKVISYVGSINKKRGILNVIKMAKEFPEAIFQVVGGSSHEVDYWINKMEEENVSNIKFVGYVDHNEVYSYLSASDVLLMVFDWSFGTMKYCSPMKMFEYMAAERVIVAQNFPTIGEVLEHKKNALLADPDSLEELKECLDVAMKMEYPNEMATNARKKVFEKYTWEYRADVIYSELKNQI
jgi:glycosyltransferase involved in cell wall biosynthesis